ncbi:YceI family protein [Flammeovirga kamogawensis]|uniref:YceI family protein n=1 Tax=Flammeovirga kamogawensis TaxID=373891 RepID=A0ABX8GZX1_9BACT|nr:YceI family protein [Flammeovirga kamogawensis]MBB6459338.1 polyisoprenoid-binding protein YceI [Flammeovirga kamogawensis]QWG08897.1 YceI family protein [Flammeovirga kamogawensis]TRX67187.1 YceI family protein [Flammeovirga kamogawensis]
MKQIIIATLLLIFGFRITGLAQENEKAEVQFSISKFFWNVEGSFDKVDYNIQFDPEHLKTSKIYGKVSISDINTSDEKRDTHLQAKEWFDSSEFPEILISSITIKAVEENHFEGLFSISIKGITKEQTISFKTLDKDGKHYLESDFKVSLEDYTIGGGTISYVVGNEVKVEIRLEY